MSEALIYRRPKVSRGELIVNRLLWLLIGLLFLFFAAQLIFHLVVSPRLLIRNIQVKSDISLSRQEVLSIAGIQEKEYYFSLNLKEVQQRLQSHPLIKGAAVEKVFPDTLSIVLQGREPVALALVDWEGSSVPAAIDEEGVVTQIGPAVAERDLLILTGLKFATLKEGVRLPEMLRPLLLELQSLKKSHPELYGLLSELKVIPRAVAGYELLLSTLCYPVKIRLSRLDGKSLQYTVMLLDLIRTQGLEAKIKELDFRTGEVVYRIKED